MIFPGSVKRVESVFTDEDGSVYDPDSSVLEFYDSTDTLIESFDEGDCTNPTPGTWYIDYPVPADAELGRWRCEWTAVVGTAPDEEDYLFVFGFHVWSTTWPTEQEVRNALNNISTDRVSQDIITYHIERAARRINKLASSAAESNDKRDAIEACAAYASYLSYALEVERAAGGMPPAVNNNLNRLYRECMFWRGIIQGYTATASRGHVFGIHGMPLSLYDDPTREPSSTRVKKP